MHGAVPLPASRSGREQRWRQTTAGCFSPHLRKESDVGQDQVVSVPAISIRAPERGAASGANSKAVTVSPFQPTPLRQERQIGRYSDRHDAISTHAPPQGERKGPGEQMPQVVRISTHAPCEGSGTSKTCFLPAKSNFNPRPHGGATIAIVRSCFLIALSIHAPMRGTIYWFSRSTLVRRLFQSTPPVQEAAGALWVRRWSGGRSAASQQITPSAHR